MVAQMARELTSHGNGAVVETIEIAYGARYIANSRPLAGGPATRAKGMAGDARKMNW